MTTHRVAHLRMLRVVDSSFKSCSVTCACLRYLFEDRHEEAELYLFYLIQLSSSNLPSDSLYLCLHINDVVIGLIFRKLLI